MDCGDLQDPSNGTVTLTGTTLGSMATYECDDGFILMGLSQRTCNNSGEWNGTAPTCEPGMH